MRSFNTVIVGIMAIVGVVLFEVSKTIFVSLPVNSPVAWCFAATGSVGLLTVLLFSVLLRHT